MLEKNKVIKFEGNLILFSALFLLISGIAYLFVPYEQKLILFSQTYFESFRDLPYPYFFFWGFMFLQAMCMIGVISLFYYLDERLKTPFFFWISKLATFGYLLMGLTYISRFYYMPKVTKEFLEGSDTVKEIVIANGTMEFDKFLMSFGFASIWFMVLSVYSIKYKMLNRPVRVISIMCSVGYAIGLIGYFVQERILTTSSSVLVIFFPFWAINMFIYCKKIINN